jgi:hypothetical protein
MSSRNDPLQARIEAKRLELKTHAKALEVDTRRKAVLAREDLEQDLRELDKAMPDDWSLITDAERATLVGWIERHSIR